MRRLFVFLFLIAFAAPLAQAKPLRFPQTGEYAFSLDLPRGWNTATDKRGGLLLVPPDHHSMIYLAILTDDSLRGQPDSAVAAKVARIAGIKMDGKQEPERLAGPDGIVRYRGTAFYGTLLWAETLPHLPTMLHDLAKRAQQGDLTLQWRSDEIAKLRREVKAANRRSFAAITAAALIISAAVVLGLDGYAPRMIADAPFVTWLLGAIALAILMSYWPSGSDRD